MFPNPVDLSKLLPTADLVINHVSKEMVGGALLAGVPQLVLPSQLEQIEISHLIEELGVGLKLSTIASRKEVLSALQKLIGDKKYGKAAEKISVAYTGTNLLCDTEKAIDEVERLLSKPS